MIDGYNGTVVINPGEQTFFEYGQRIERETALEEGLFELHDELAVTLDGHAITLSANIERAEDAGQVLESGAEGVLSLIHI